MTAGTESGLRGRGSEGYTATPLYVRGVWGLTASTFMGRTPPVGKGGGLKVGADITLSETVVG